MSELLMWIYIFIWIFLLGACIFSFLNVVIYRVPLGIFWRESRSSCPNCKTTLGFFDLIPIFSYIFLKGRCRYCKNPISPRYPLMEFGGGLGAIICFTHFGFDWKAVVAFLMVCVLTAIAMIDLDTMEIPDILQICLIPLAVVSIWLWKDITILERLIGFFAISLPLLILTIIIPDSFGGGDIKLMAICGFFLGWKYILLAFFMALILGGFQAVWIMNFGKRSKHMPFGPHLAVGIVIAMLYGKEILDWYLKFFL